MSPAYLSSAQLCEVNSSRLSPHSVNRLPFGFRSRMTPCRQSTFYSPLETSQTSRSSPPSTLAQAPLRSLLHSTPARGAVSRRAATNRHSRYSGLGQDRSTQWLVTDESRNGLEQSDSPVQS